MRDVALFVRALATQNISLSVKGDQLRVEYDDRDLTEATRQEVKQHKQEIINFLLKTNIHEHLIANDSQLAEESMPQCFLDSPCRCGQYHAIKDTELGWISPCYFLALAETKKPRPPLSNMDLSEARRELRTRCVRCSKAAIWWGDGWTPFCDHCWREQGKMKWYMETSPERKFDAKDAS